MKTEIKRFLLTCPLAFLTLIIPSFLGNNQLLSSALLLLAGLLMLSIDWSCRNLLFYFAILITGPLSEAMAIYFGAWTYTNPVFIGIPIWLPFVWGNAGIYVIRLKDAIFSLKK